MSRPATSAAAPPAVARRPRFRERQVVSATELVAEQAYLVDLVRRHRIGGHSWGIVAGLALVPAPDGVLVQPGVAVDGFGRELVVPAPVTLPADAFERLDADAVDVWLLYGRVADTPPQRGRWECGAGRHSRWREEPCLRVTPSAGAARDPREPPGVGVDGLQFGPQDDPPDGSAPIWPVLLGRLVRDAVAGANGYTVDPAQRPYAGLVGGRIVHPTGSDAVQVGGEPARFAVQTADEGGALGDWVTVDLDGNTAIAVNTTLGGDLLLEGSTPEASGLAFTPLGAAPTVAAPWRAYRTSATAGGRTVNQLRMEIEHPAAKGDPQRYALSVGYADAAGAFVRLLTITSECVVAVDGEVHVEGVLKPGPVGVDPDNPLFQAALLDRWLRGIASASQRLGAVYAGALALGSLQLTPNDAAATATCQVTASNPGPVALPSVALTATVIANGTTFVTNAPMGNAFSLEPGGSLSRSATFGPMAAGTIDLTVTARATAPAGYQVSATAHGTTTLHVIVI